MEVQWKEFYKILDENLSPFIKKISLFMAATVAEILLNGF